MLGPWLVAGVALLTIAAGPSAQAQTAAPRTEVDSIDLNAPPPLPPRPPARRVPPGAGVDTVLVDGEACLALVRHQPDADVAFRPGLDVSGRQVVPAELAGATRIDIPETIRFPLTINLAPELGDSLGGFAPDTQVALGEIAIRGSDVFFNGQRLVGQDEALLAEACRQSLTVTFGLGIRDAESRDEVLGGRSRAEILGGQGAGDPPSGGRSAILGGQSRDRILSGP